jgi:hypothetical protein
MDLGIGVKIAGAIFLVTTAIGFEIENVWVFLAGALLLIAWVGAVLTGAHNANANR